MVRYTFSLLICEYTDCSFGKRNPNSLHSSQHEEFSPYTENIPYINLWIKCAMSHNVENLSFQIWNQYYEYKLPDFFYNSSSFKQLNISAHTIVPLECNVSWTSLQTLSLSSFRLSDESMAKILSGCPVLEKLKL